MLLVGFVCRLSDWIRRNGVPTVGIMVEFRCLSGADQVSVRAVFRDSE